MTQPLPIPFQFTLTNVTVGYTAEIPVNRDGRISFEILPVGAAITGLKVQTRLHPNSDYSDELVNADFSAQTVPTVLRASSAAPETTADGGRGWARLNIGMVYSLRFVVTLAGPGSVVIRGSH